MGEQVEFTGEHDEHERSQGQAMGTSPRGSWEKVFSCQGLAKGSGLMGDVIWDLCRGLSECVNDLLKVTLRTRSGQGVCS